VGVSAPLEQCRCCALSTAPARRSGVIAAPTAVLVDRTGRLGGGAVGPRDRSGPAAALLDELLK
jgi:hypothetical protein